jgi:mxaJ protein
MSSRCRNLALVVVLACSPLGARELVVCADPDDLPYSSEQADGFENRVARVVAEEIGATLRIAWQPLRRGVVRKTLGAGACDALAGVPIGLEGVATTAPYYRSTYVVVQRRDGAAAITSFDDPRLRDMTVGVQLVGADMAAAPPALALARRGIVANVRGYPVFGDTPAAQRMIDAVAAGTLDAAFVWGPQAGYYVQRARRPLTMTAVRDGGEQFAIAMAVRKDDTALRNELDAALARAHERIAAVLREYGVPVMESSP